MWEGKSVFITENRQSRNEMCSADTHNNMCHIGLCAKRFLDSNFTVIDKISTFTKLLQISHITKILFFLNIVETF